jgi:hypothetical protein
MERVKLCVLHNQYAFQIKHVACQMHPSLGRGQLPISSVRKIVHFRAAGGVVLGKRRRRQDENQFGRDQLPLIRSVVEDTEFEVSRTKTTNTDEQGLVPTETNFRPTGSTTRVVFVMS